jgi:RND family efflux transporter MFP subunit
MNEKPSLDSLRINRAAKPQRGLGTVFGVLAIFLLLAGAGAATWYFWPAPGIAVKAITAEAEGGTAGASGLDATGYVMARRLATLSAKILGKMVEMNVEEGQHVKAGFVVARLDDSNILAALHQAQAQARLAKTALDDEQTIFVRYQKLHDQNAISTDAFENQRAAYDAARENLDVADAQVGVAQASENDTVIRAPYEGVVTDKEAQVGEIVAPSAAGGGQTRTGIATIVDMDSLEVDVDVSENYIDRVRAGGDATIRLDAYPDWQIPADVIAIIPTADQTKGTVRVRVGIKAKDPRILPEMGARVSFVTGVSAGPITHGVIVPREAVKDEGRNGTVFVLRDDKSVELRQVMLGSKTAQSVVLLSGVSAGERLAVGDFAQLHDGAKVEIRE